MVMITVAKYPQGDFVGGTQIVKLLTLLPDLCQLQDITGFSHSEPSFDDFQK